jgi:hypothetical protein
MAQHLEWCYEWRVYGQPGLGAKATDVQTRKRGRSVGGGLDGGKPERSSTGSRITARAQERTAAVATATRDVELFAELRLADQNASREKESLILGGALVVDKWPPLRCSLCHPDMTFPGGTPLRRRPSDRPWCVRISLTGWANG